ncbi:MAG: PhnD/SsuA/transferrin family substrate-binding protein [Candidatus Thiodiazotropha sp. (ex Myrtea sp. 'scaly one' KF741663)]|nr:PhnD/SsuA/transferrin family substrate-binding protein [Candidatus Thiodiazotropha sp. (ex Myrtea sp. 'scaly one' KF741663)]
MLLRRTVAWMLVFFYLGLCPADDAVADITQAGQRPVTIGVLAKRGTQVAIDRWSPTADYLNQQIPDLHFHILPLTFEQIPQQIQSQGIDLLLANSAIYIQSEHNFHAFRIATLINRSGNFPLASFGGVIFTRHDQPDISTLTDLKQKRFAAVNPTSLGGYLMAWRELEESGITIDSLNVDFYGTHDDVVRAVLDGEVDAGTVRTDTLERMAASDLIDLHRIRLLNPKQADDFPFLLSTRLYPEWPMAALPHTPNKLVKKVTRALLNMPHDHPAAVTSHSFGWTVPSNYQPVHVLFEVLNLPPHKIPPPTIIAWAKTNPIAAATTTASFLLIAVFLLYLAKLNHRLNHSQKCLAASMEKQQHVTDQLADNLARLRESEEKFASLAKSALDAIIMLNPQGRVEFWNLAAEKIFGYSAVQAIGMEISQWLLPAQQKPNDQTDDILASINKPESFLNGTTLELSSVRLNGELFPTEIALSSVCLNGSWHTICILRDITRRKQMETERRQMEIKLSQNHKMEALSQMASGIAHEINTPIQTITNNLRFLQEAIDDMESLFETYEPLLTGAQEITHLASQVEECKKAQEELDPDFLKEETGKAIEQSFDGAEQVTRIVRSMRVFAHPEKPTAEKSDLNKLIHDVVAISRHRWSGAATIEFDLHKPTLEADCFPGDLSQALLNLLVNAVQAVEERSDELPGVIHISSRKLPTCVEIRVGDNGLGIPSEARDHIFNPFFTTRDVGQGSGQGLTLTHDVIVRKHRGSLCFDTEMERGTVFTIRLPIHADEESPSPAVDAVLS